MKLGFFNLYLVCPQKRFKIPIDEERRVQRFYKDVFTCSIQLSNHR